MYLGTEKFLQLYIIIVFNTVINKCNFIDVHEKEIPSSTIYKHLGKFTLLECVLRARDFKEIDKTWAFKRQTNSKSVGYCYIIDPDLFDADNDGNDGNNVDVIKMVVDSKLLSTKTIKPTTIPTESSNITTKPSAITTMVNQDGFTTNPPTNTATLDKQNTTTNVATPDQQNTTTNIATTPYPNNTTKNINTTVNNISSTEPVSSSLVSTTEIIVSTTESPVLTTESSVSTTELSVSMTESSISTTELIVLPLCVEVCLSNDSCIDYGNVEYVDYPCECFYQDDCLTKNRQRIKNIALDGTAEQLGEPYTSYGVRFTADLAIDGDLNTGQHTKTHDKPWWKVVLQRLAKVLEVRLFRRETHQGRYANMHLIIGYATNSNNGFVSNEQICSNDVFPRDVFNSRIACLATGKYVKLQSQSNNNWLNINEVKVFGYYLS